MIFLPVMHVTKHDRLHRATHLNRRAVHAGVEYAYFFYTGLDAAFGKDGHGPPFTQTLLHGQA